jgi:hypothetical protein
VYFLGYTAKEVQKRLDDHLREAKYDASLTLLAAIEAALWLDFDYGRTRKLKDSKSKKIRESQLDHRSPIEDIIKLLLGGSVPKHIITALKICFNYRHWLAHGRYWRLNLGKEKPTFEEIFILAQTIEKALYTVEKTEPEA